MNIGKEAEKFIVNYFERKRKIRLLRPQRGERGFDFRNRKRTLFIEVKGSGGKKPPHFYFTNTEYERARECLQNHNKYEIHLLIGVGTDRMKHYKIDAKTFLDKARPEIVWSFPVRREINDHEI